MQPSTTSVEPGTGVVAHPGPESGAASGHTRGAAFLRIEGVLLSRPGIAAAAYFAANAQGLAERFARLGNVALAAPLAFAAQVGAGTTAVRATWMGVRGMGEDRLVELAREYYERFVEPRIRGLGRDLLAQARKRGDHVVLVSDNVDIVVGGLIEELGADEIVCNRLEVRRGEATGRLLDPVVGGHLGGSWARRFVEERGLDLERSSAFGASASDGLLLSAVGRPCAVRPDPWLRTVARDQGWPVIDD